MVNGTTGTQGRAGKQKNLTRLPCPMLPISTVYYPCHPCNQWSKTPALISQALCPTVSFIQTTRFKASSTDAKLHPTTPNSSQRDLATSDSEIISRPFAFFAGKVIEIWNFIFVSNFGFRASSFLPKGKTRQIKVKQGRTSQNKVPPEKKISPTIPPYFIAFPLQNYYKIILNIVPWVRQTNMRMAWHLLNLRRSRKRIGQLVLPGRSSPKLNIVSRKFGLIPVVLFLVSASFLAQAQPTILSQPVSLLNQVLGLQTTLSVTAQGNTPLSYQWRLNGVNIPGATNNTYVIGGLLSSDCGAYNVAVSDAYLSVNSLVARVTASLLADSGNDNFSSRASLLGLAAGNVRSDNLNATKESKEPNHAGNVGGKSIWFKWTPLSTGIVTFTTRGSGFDTLLAAYTGSSVSNLKVVPSSVSDDDRGGYLTSQISFNATALNEYEIAVDGFNGASGDVVLSWNEVITSDLLPKIEDHPATSSVVSDDGSVNLSLTCDPSTVTWLFNGLPTSIHTTNLSILDVNDATVGNYVAQAVSSGGHSTFSLPSHVQINLHQDGTTDTNALALDKFRDSTAIVATQTLVSSQRAGKGISAQGAGDSRSYTTTQIFSTAGATKESGEPNHCGQAGGSSVWYSYKPPTNGLLHVHTEGSGFNTILAIYIGPGDSFATLTNVGCGYTTNFTLLGQPHVYIPSASSNTTYYIVVDGMGGASGTVHLNINLGSPLSIVSAPLSQTVAPGTNATFSVATAGSGPVGVQWQFNGHNIPNATNATLIITNIQPSQVGAYSVAVSNVVSSVFATANLNLTAAPSHFGSLSLSGGLAQCQITATPGSTNVIQASTNLIDWTSILTNVAGGSPINFAETFSTNFHARFFRVISQ